MREANKVKISINKFIASPYMPVIFPLGLLLISFIFPPNVYEYYVNEPNYMFLNFKILIFALLCSLFYFMGIFVARYKPILPLSKRQLTPNFLFYLKYIVYFTIFLQIISIIFLSLAFSKKIGMSLIELAYTGRAESIKDLLGKEIKLPFGLGAVLSVIPAIKF